MNLRRSMAARAAVSVTAMALLIGPSAAGALAQEEPAPTPTPEVATEPVPTTTSEAAPKAPLPLKDNTFLLGQSMQIRVNADLEQNSGLANFRWTVSQLTVQGPPDGSKDGTYDVPVPEGGTMSRYLTSFGKPPIENGEAQFSVDVEQGAGTQRTVSLFPQDDQPVLSMTSSFTLDGEPITAKDLVGKSGVVTAQYVVSNLSTKPYEVTVNDLAGNPVTKTVDADVPMVGIIKTLLPQRYTGLNTGTGQFGADGRGNNQVQWIALPFKPLSKDGTATFGWSANVTDAVVPSLLAQIAPLYIPAHSDDPATPNVDESQSSSPPVNLDPAIAEIQAGLASVLAGVEAATAGGGTDPLDVAQDKLNAFFTSLGVNIQTVATLIDPNNPDSVTAQLVTAQNLINEIVASGAIDKVQQGADILTPERAQAIQDVIPAIQRIAANASLLASSISVGCIDPPGQIGPSLPPEVCNNKDQLIAILQSEELQQVAALLGQLDGKIVPLSQGLQTLAELLPGIVATLQPLLDQLVPALIGLSGQMTLIANGLQAVSVDLPPLDAVIATIVADVLATPAAQQITGGLAQVGTGVGLAKTEIATFAAELIVALKGAAGTGNEAVVAAKASIAGLLAAAATPPIIYGPLPEGTPPGTVLAGAYEFRVDAADTNGPYTLPRILVGLLALIGAGLIVMFLGKKKDGSDGDDTDGPDSSVDYSATPVTT